MKKLSSLLVLCWKGRVIFLLCKGKFFFFLKCVSSIHTYGENKCCDNFVCMNPADSILISRGFILHEFFIFFIFSNKIKR